MDKAEGIVTCTISVCATVVLGIFIISCSQCQMEMTQQKQDTYEAAIKRADATVILMNGRP